MSLQIRILMFPFYKYVQWIFGYHFDFTNISFELISKDANMLQFRIEHQKLPPWKSSPFNVKKIDEFCKPLSIDQFAKNLIIGELMAFIPNELK